jgi:subtilisin family serine protease
MPFILRGIKTALFYSIYFLTKLKNKVQMKKRFWIFLALLLALFAALWAYWNAKAKEKPQEKPAPKGIIHYTVEAKNAPDYRVTIAYKEDEYVVNFPENTADAEQMRQHLINVKGLHLVSTCPCSDKLQLWGGTVKVIPDGSTPPPPPEPGGNGTSFTKNYLLMEKEDSTRKYNDNQFNTSFEGDHKAKNEVKIAIVDSGMDFSGQGTNPLAFLFENTVNRNPLICNSPNLKEGRYGMNVLNWLANPDSLEPKDTDGHGTFINGIIAGKANMPVVDNTNNPYIGDYKDADLKLLHVRFVRSRKQDATLFDALCGVHFALKKGAKVINASWRSLANDTNRDSLKKSYTRVMQAIKDSNAILVAGSGNDYLKDPTSNADMRVFPASFSRDPAFEKNVIAVGAWDLAADKVANFSNEGKFIDIYAPGVDIISTDLNNAQLQGMSQGSGTSYATPYVSRLVAILMGNNPTDPITNLKERIVRNVDGTPTSRSIKLLNHKNAVDNLVR